MLLFLLTGPTWGVTLDRENHFMAVLKVGLEALADDLNIEVKRKREIADDS